jgi:integrase
MNVATLHKPECAAGMLWTPTGTQPAGCSCRPGDQPAAGQTGHSRNRSSDGPSLQQLLVALADATSTEIGATVGFSEWADRWLSLLERKSSTIGSYRSTVNLAKGVFDGLEVREIRVEEIANFVGALRDRGCSASTRAKHLRVLGACLQAAVSYRYADSNPVRELPSAQRPRPERKEAAYFENAELPGLFNHLTLEPYRTICLIALKTGMRQGELIALRWCDVDLGDAVIRVRQSLTGGVLSTPKNRERRDVDLITDVTRLLQARHDRYLSADQNGLVFPGPTDTPISSTYLLKRCLYPAMIRAGIPREGPTAEKRTFHSFRHTFAKRALENGAQVTWLSRHLGHSTLKVTTDIYGHWERAERKLQAARMENAFPV